MVYVIQVCCDSLRAGSGRHDPKHVEFHSKNKFEILVHLVGSYYMNLILYFYLLCVLLNINLMITFMIRT